MMRNRISYRLWTFGISSASGQWLSIDICGPFHDFKVDFCRQVNDLPTSFATVSRRAVIIALACSYTPLWNASTSNHDSQRLCQHPYVKSYQEQNREDGTYNLKRQQRPETEEHYHDDSRVEVETRERLPRELQLQNYDDQHHSTDFSVNLRHDGAATGWGDTDLGDVCGWGEGESRVGMNEGRAVLGDELLELLDTVRVRKSDEGVLERNGDAVDGT